MTLDEKSIGCEERNRLLNAHRRAQGDQCELEEELGRLLVSANRGQARKAKNDIEHARRKTNNTFKALISHQSKHGCG